MQDAGEKFTDSIIGKDFLFTLVLSFTKTCEIPGITVAGAQPAVLKFTAAGDAEYIHYGKCKSIDTIPMTPDGKPTPALLTRASLLASKMPYQFVDAGCLISPQSPLVRTGLPPTNNIDKTNASTRQDVLNAVDAGKRLGQKIIPQNYLVIGESMPGGTTSALAVLCGMNKDAKVSSSMPQNPISLKESVVAHALDRITSSDDPYDIVSKVGDLFIPFTAGMLCEASRRMPVLLAGGTQMAAVLVFADFLKFDKNKTALGTTKYIIDDKSANLISMLDDLQVPLLAIDPQLDKSSFIGLQSYARGFVKEGAGAGGTMIASMLSTSMSSMDLLKFIDDEYTRLSTLP